MSGFGSNATYYAVLGRNADGTRIDYTYWSIRTASSSTCGIFYSGDGDAPISSVMGNARPTTLLPENRLTGTGQVLPRHDGEHTR